MNESTPHGLTIQSRAVRRRWRWLVLLGAGVVLFVLAVSWSWRAPAPPSVDCTGVEPDIVRVIANARADVVAAPRSAAAWGQLGMVLRAHDFAAQANECFVQAERFDPTDPRWPYLHALSLALTDHAAAIPLLRRAVEQSDGASAPALRLAELLFVQGRGDEAEALFQRVLRSESAHGRARLGLARLAQERGDAAEALEQARLACTCPLTRKAGLQLRAALQQQLGADGAAQQDLRQAQGLLDDPPWPDPIVEEVERLRVGTAAQLALAERWLQQGRGDEAVALLEDMTRTRVPDAALALGLGTTLLRLNRPAHAEQAFRAALALTPEAAEVHFQLGNALFLQDRPAPAAACFRTALRCQPAHALAHYNLGHCLLRTADRRAAAAEFAETLRYRPNHADAHTNLGALLAADGKVAEARQHLEYAVQLAPSDARARRLLAELLAHRAPP